MAYPLDWLWPCGESPLGDFCTLRLEESPEEKFSPFAFQPRRDDWNQARGTVRPQTRYTRALTYGPDPSLYMTHQPPQDLPSKRGGGEGEGNIKRKRFDRLQCMGDGEARGTGESAGTPRLFPGQKCLCLTTCKRKIDWLD